MTMHTSSPYSIFDRSSMPSPSSLAASLHAFTSSHATFRVLHTIPPFTAQASPSSSSPLHAARTLLILDSSFNPPTLAHLSICLSALSSAPTLGPRRLLLLLATENADKPSKPARFEHRLGMMSVLASDLQKRLYESNVKQNAQEGDGVPVDIGVCKPPLFVDKVKAIAEGGVYGENVEQVHLLGYDTFTKLMDPKYYPPRHSLEPLQTLFRRGRVRVMMRAEGNSGKVEGKEQVEYLRRLRDGDREYEGGRREWAERVELIDPEKDAEGVSSTRVRDVVLKGKEGLEGLVTKGVSEWIDQKGLYKDDGGD